MKRLPLTDALPYRFYPPRLDPICMWASRFIMPWMLRRMQRVETVDIAGTEALEPLLGRGDGVLLAPNHCDYADCYMMFELGRRLRMPFFYMAAYQIFTGKARWALPRVGVFPVDREGSDLTAFKTAVDVLARARNPLVVFPEGEIYHLCDRLTPCREGAVALATTAVKRLGDAGKTVWIVPIALKYRFLEGVDPLPSLYAQMDRLEERFTWWPRRERPLVERIYDYAAGVLGLKEHEYLGAVQPGLLPDRVAGLAHRILERVEDRRRGKRSDEPVPVRVKELRRACLDVLADPATTPAQANAVRRDLHDVFTAVQCFSYPGNYIQECPTVERVAETLMKFEEDFLGISEARPHGARLGVIRIGAPMDVRAAIAAAGKPRLAVGTMTADLESRLQALLDTIGPGRPLAPPPVAVPQALQEV